jgi:regulator of protease activity HflC (stomatin/prohibitin superfamily)
MPGNYIIPPFHTVEKYNADEAFTPKSTPIEILLKDEALVRELEITDIPDGHIAVRKEQGNIAGVHTSGKTYFWKGLRERTMKLLNLNDPESAASEDRALLTHTLLKDFVIDYYVEAYQKGVLFLDRVFKGVLESGTYYFWRGVKPVDVYVADIRQQQLEISGQEIMTGDKVPLRLNFFCHYRVTDVKKAIFDIANSHDEQFRVLLQVALRNYIGGLSFDEVIEQKDSIGKKVTALVKEDAAKLGLELGTSGIKDIILPGEIRTIMNQVIIAEKQAQANVIMRREETASTRSLLNTAKLMEENAVLFRLKEFEYIEKIAEKINQITLSGNGQIVEQLRELFIPAAKKTE